MVFPAYIICGTPRSGSTLLCDLLSATGIAGQPHSYFRSEDIDYWADLWGVEGPTAIADRTFNRAYLAAMTQAGTAGTGMFGLRLMWESVSETAERLHASLGGDADIVSLFERAFGPTLFIHLSRHDKAAQAVSLVRAEQTGLWHVAADGTERERTAPARAPAFDAERLAATKTLLASHDDRWSSFFDRRGIDPFILSYEDLVADPPSTLATLLRALGRDPAAAADVTVKTAKMADSISSDWTDRLKR